jgi:hypothetical protein
MAAQALQARTGHVAHQGTHTRALEVLALLAKNGIAP